MTRSQQASRRTVLLGLLAEVSAELSQLDALTFQPYIVTVEQDCVAVNGAPWQSDLPALLRGQGIDEAALPPGSDWHQATAEFSSQPPALEVAYPIVGATEEPYTQNRMVEWSLL